MTCHLGLNTNRPLTAVQGTLGHREGGIDKGACPGAPLGLSADRPRCWSRPGQYQFVLTAHRLYTQSLCVHNVVFFFWSRVWDTLTQQFMASSGANGMYELMKYHQLAQVSLYENQRAESLFANIRYSFKGI